MEERRVVHRLETIRWSHADDNGDNGDDAYGEDDEGMSPPNGRFKYFLIATFHSWCPPNQAQALVGEEPSGEIPQVEKRMGWTCPYFWT